jgi:hypothetical protein
MAERLRINWDLCGAADRGDVIGIASALSAGADVEADVGSGPGHPLREAAARQGHVGAMVALLRAGANANLARARDGWVPLMSAALSGKAEAVAVLVAAGALVNYQHHYGGTALHVATECCCVDAARELLHAGARVSLRDNEGLCPSDLVRGVACVQVWGGGGG